MPNCDELASVVRSYLKGESFCGDLQKALASFDAAKQSAPSEPTPTENTLIGQAQHLIGALIDHKLIPNTLPEDQYLNLWDVVKRQLHCVNKEGARHALGAPRDLTDAELDALMPAVLREKHAVVRLSNPILSKIREAMRAARAAK